jgi:hypothetical protein
MTNGTQDEPKIQYREDGKIPIGIWIVWLAYAVFAIVYASRYAWPDFVKWVAEVRGHG